MFVSPDWDILMKRVGHPRRRLAMMDLNHLHLHVHDTERSRRFYEAWFGFREHARHDDLLFVRNGDGSRAHAGSSPRGASRVVPFRPTAGIGGGGPGAPRPHASGRRSAAEAAPRGPGPGELPQRGDLDGYEVEVYWE